MRHILVSLIGSHNMSRNMTCTTQKSDATLKWVYNEIYMGASTVHSLILVYRYSFYTKFI